MKDTYRILHVEDVATDAELAAIELKKFDIEFEQLVIDTEEGYLDALDNFKPDIILCDHSLPAFNSLEALRIVKARKLFIPFVIITATMSEEVAMDVVKEGADDYILKDRLKRLPTSVLNNIEKYRFETERRKLIDVVREKEAASKELLEQLSNKLLLATKVTGIGIWEYEIGINKFHADENLYAIYGVPLVSFASLVQYVHAEDKERVSKEIQEALLQHVELKSEFRIISCGGSIRYLKGMTIIQRDSSGNATRIIGTNQDVTADKEVQKVIEESEVKYRAIFENSLDGILLSEPNGKILAANTAACTAFGMTEAELVEGGRSAILDTADPRLQTLLEKRRITGNVKGDITFKRKDGSKFPGEISSVVFKDARGIERTSMIIRDVSERKLSEQKVTSTSNALTHALSDLQRIMDSSLDIICTIDEEGRFVNISAACGLTWGYTPEELRGKEYINFVFEEDIQKTIEAAQTIVGGNSLTMFENRYKHKNGSVVPVLWSARWDENEKLMFCIAKDATEKKRLEKAFIDERQRFYDLFLNAPASVGIFAGPEHVFQMVNPLYLQLTGRTNIVGKPVREVFPEVENQGLFDLLDNVYKTGDSFIGKERLIKVDKEGTGNLSEVYLNFIYQAYRNDKNDIEGVFFFAIDVTEQVISRKKVEESEKRFRQLIYDLPAALYTCDAEGTIMLYNKAAEQLWGRKPETGKDLWCGSWKIYKSDGSALPPDQCPMALTLKERRPVEGWEVTIERPDGVKRRVRPNPIPTFNADGQLTGAVNLLIDVTDITLVQEKLQENQEQLLESQRIAHIGSWQLNFGSSGTIDANPIYCSEETYRIFGFPYKEVENFDVFSKFINPKDRQLVKKSFEKAVATRSSFSIDFRIVNTKGSKRWVHMQAKVITNAVTNEPLKMFGTIKDITVTKEHELQIEKNTEEREILIAELTKSINDLKQFTFITSHNFRAPLSNLIGLLGLLDYDSFTEKNQEIIGMFRSSTLQLNKTINDLIQILIIKNNVNINIANIDLPVILEETLQLLTYEMSEIDCTINTDLAVKTVTFNKSYLESILINLFTNAIKYRSPLRPLKINVKSSLTKNGEVLIAVQDNGLGIDLKRHSSKMFGLYQRFHTNADGAGLGLFMVKSQITSLGGSIEVESEEDKGTTFFITLKKEHGEPGHQNTADKGIVGEN